VKRAEPVLITGKRGSVVLVSEHDWWAIQETLHLLSIPADAQALAWTIHE
jgi:PHD/YefM family antitoxin component YafN of YafNO toxin-antitoxin module